MVYLISYTENLIFILYLGEFIFANIKNINYKKGEDMYKENGKQTISYTF